MDIDLEDGLQRVTAPVRGYIDSRRKSVESGAETAELATLLIQKYGNRRV